SPAFPLRTSWRLPSEVACQRVFAEPDRRRGAERPRVEGELERDAVHEGEDDSSRLHDVDPAERPSLDPLGDERADLSAHPPVECGVDLAQPPVVHHLAPELHEHDPEFPLLPRQPETGGDERAQARAGVAGTPGLGGGDPAVEVRHHHLERANQDRSLVGEVVVEDPLADARLAGHLLQREARVAVAGQAADRGAHDLLPPERGDADLGAHAFFLIGRPIIIEPGPAVKRAPAADGDPEGPGGGGAQAPARRRAAARSASSRSSSTPEWSAKVIAAAIARWPARSAMSRCIAWQILRYAGWPWGVVRSSITCIASRAFISM